MLEAGQSLGTIAENIRQDLDGDIASEVRVLGAVTSPMRPLPGSSMIRQCKLHVPMMRDLPAGTSRNATTDS